MPLLGMLGNLGSCSIADDFTYYCVPQGNHEMRICGGAYCYIPSADNFNLGTAVRQWLRLHFCDKPFITVVACMVCRQKWLVFCLGMSFMANCN